MNPAETMKLLRLISGYHPGFAMNDHTPAAWNHALADIPAAEATAAVHAHYATGGPWIMPADVRRRVLQARGLLPPDPETAYEQAVRMNRWLDCRTGPEPEIHPAAIAAARAIGWQTFDSPEGMAHRRFVDSYRPKAERAAETALTTPLPALETEVRAPKALPGGLGVEAARKAEEGTDTGTSRKAAELRQRTSGRIARLDDAIAALGADARFLLQPGQKLDSEFGQAALRHRMRSFGGDRNPDEALRQARQEIAQNQDSQVAAAFEAHRAAALRALEAMGNDGTEETA